MRHWYLPLGVSLLGLVLTRSMATAGWDDHIGPQDDDRSERPRKLDSWMVIDDVCWVESESGFEPSGPSPAGRCFDIDWTINGEPAWLRYLAGGSEKGGDWTPGDSRPRRSSS